MTAAGIQLALQQMAKMVRDARTRPDVQAFARRVAGPYKTTAERARALLDVIRTNARYSVPLMTSIGAMRYSTPTGSALVGPVDDDDMAVAFATACESVGIVTELKLVSVGHHTFTVVVVVHEDDRQWTFSMHEPIKRNEE
jgi:hypothetical protein